MSKSVDKLIEEWLAEEDCMDLPGAGKPLNLDEYFSWPEDQRLGFSLLKNAGYRPEEVEIMSEIKRLSEEVEKCSDQELRTRLKRKLQEEQVRLSLRLEQSRRRKKNGFF
jgi:Domain of unknown function (DUF1992)